MKKILFLAAACAALAACNVSDLEKDTPEINGDAFVKGQKVVLKVNAGSETKAAGTLDGYAIGFTWSTGDKIKVMVGEASAEFTLKGEGGSASGEFEGEMPGTGTTFSAQYPAEDPDLTSQTYDPSHAIASGLMKATATGCTVGSSIELKPDYAVLRLNLYGDACKVKQIVVTNTTSTASPKPSYLLNFDESAAISSDSSSPTPFFIVVPAGETAWDFKAHVLGESTSTMPKYPANAEPNYGSGIPIVVGSCSTTSAKTFNAGECLNMAAFPVTTTVWAPVNCGYEPATTSPAYKGYPYGKLYQWGRKYGQGYYKAGSGSTPTYEDADYPGKAGGNQFLVDSSSPQTSYPDGDTYNGKFYYDQTMTMKNWYGGSDPDKLWNSNEGTSYPVSKSGFDPCPEGWRVPTEAELSALVGSHTSGPLQDGDHGCLTNIKGKYFDGSTTATPTSGVFLPAAGTRNFNAGSASLRGSSGRYWSSTVYGNDYAKRFYFSSSNAGVSKAERANGFSIRCVQK